MSFSEVSVAVEQGDPSFAADIAQENHFSEGDLLPVNTLLFIPNLVSTNVHNWQGIEPSYDSQVIIGSFYPYMPFPPPSPPPLRHRSFLKMAIEIVVGAVILAFEPELAGFFMETFLLPSILAYAAAGGVLGIASSFAQQETARALHDQDHFSWKAMWLSD